jgi:DNA polymerase
MHITLDFETYYDSDYSLKKLTTEEYIRDVRFEVIGVSIKVDRKPALWISGTFEQIRAALLRIDWSKVSSCAHNSMFDMGILAWRFGIVPMFIFDTLSMARGIVGFSTRLSLATLAIFFDLKSRKGEEVLAAKGKRRADFTPNELANYGRYCCNDTELCFELWEKLMALSQPSELRLIDWTIRAFTQPGLVLDLPLLRHELTQYRARSATLLQTAGVTDIATLRSDETFASLLLNNGAVPPTKVNTAGVTKWAFARSDIEFMDLLEHEDELVVALVEARLGSKSSIVESRLTRLCSIAQRGAMPMPLLYAGAMASKRWSGTDKINLQNLPRNKIDKATKQVIHSPLRAAIRPPPGKKLLVADLSQIELRINAWQAGQQDVLDLLASGGDTYSDMASVIYAIIITKAMGKSTHSLERFVGKTTVLGCGYQCGPEKFLHMLKVAARRDGFVLSDETLDFAKRVVYAYRGKNAAIVNFWKLAQNIIPVLAHGGSGQLGPYAISHNKVWLPNGTFLYYPDLRMTHDEKTGNNEWSYLRMRGRNATRQKLYGGKLVENITQAVARVVMSDAMLRILPRYWIYGTVHDELMVQIDAHEDERAAMDFVEHCMTQCPTWAPGIPLAAELSTGVTYAECK